MHSCRIQAIRFSDGNLVGRTACAGKTVLSAYVAQQLQGNVILINGDEYRRYHPNYKLLYHLYGTDIAAITSKFASAVVEKSIARLSDLRHNLIIEGTGRTYEVPQRTGDLLAHKGYKVELYVIAAKPEMSLLSTIKRFCAMADRNTVPRATAIDAHDVVVKNLPENLNRLSELSYISRIKIMDRDATLLYDSAYTQELHGDVLKGFWNTPYETDEISSLWGQVRQLQTADNNGIMAEQLNILTERLPSVTQEDTKEQYEPER